MLEAKKIARINELALKSKKQPLSDAEKAEQQDLRNQYLVSLRTGFGEMLENISIQNPDGSITPVTKRDDSQNRG